MTGAIIAALIAALLAFGLASVGEILVLRTSRGLFGWNASFLIGSAACAALLFPLSVVAPRHALDAELGLIAFCVLASGWRRFVPASSPAPRETWNLAVRHDWAAMLLLTAIVSLCLFFAALNHWYGHTWDSIQVWGTKAKMLYFEGGLSRRWFLENAYDERLLSYPSLIPFLEALFGRLRGTFDLDAAKAIFPMFHVSMLLATYAAARTVSSVRWALGTVLLVALLPELTTSSAAGAYVDMPLAAFVAAVVAASLRRGAGDGRALPWLIGSMTAVKQEGMILTLIACGAILLSWIAERPRRIGERLRAAVPGAAVVLAFIAARVGYVRWIGVHDTTWGPLDTAHLVRGLQNAGVIVSLCLRYLLEPQTWGLFWPAFFVAGALTVVSGLSRTAILALATAAAIVVDGGLFLMTNWPLELHIAGSYSRLLAQLSPAAAVVIGATGQRLWSQAPSTP
jgi:hypothetical protein